MKILKKFGLATAILSISSLSFAECATTESSANNSESQATTGLCSGTMLDGSMSSTSDIDWFALDVAQAGVIDVTVNHHRRDDFDIDIYASTGGALASGSSSSRPETASTNVSSAGIYYVKISSYKGSGWYELTINFPEESDNTGGNTGGGDCGYGSIPSKPNQLTVYETGNSTSDSCANLTAGQGATILMGGGSDVDSIWTDRVLPHVGSEKDVVVLRTDRSNGYNDYLYGLMDADSVVTLVVDAVSEANSDYVDWMVRSAEHVFIAGGDQAEYLNLWKGTKLNEALQHVYDKGGVIGGTSAGMAVMTEYIYDPDGVLGAITEEVVVDPCHETINISTGFLDIPPLRGTIADTHFWSRDRMGRLVTFMANLPSSTKGIGVAESTALYVEADGTAHYEGNYEAYVLREDSGTSLVQFQCGENLIFNDIVRTKVLSNGSYNLIDNSYTNGQIMDISVNGGQSGFYTPSDPY